jgi:hypothetical protein
MLVALLASQPGWTPLFNGKTLDGWEVVGEGVWTVMSDGTLLGQCDPRNPCLHQSWLYTKKEFGEFDLYLEFWTRLGGNSGVSIRDTSRARWAVGAEYDRNRTPSHIGYEIQIVNGYPDRFLTGSIYNLVPADDPHMRNDWNTLEIESRFDRIRVKLNGKLVAEHSGLPDRPKVGPIGLQLHDPNSIVMFRNIRIREITPPSPNQD